MSSDDPTSTTTEPEEYPVVETRATSSRNVLFGEELIDTSMVSSSEETADPHNDTNNSTTEIDSSFNQMDTMENSMEKDNSIEENNSMEDSKLEDGNPMMVIEENEITENSLEDSKLTDDPLVIEIKAPSRPTSRSSRPGSRASTKEGVDVQTTSVGVDKTEASTNTSGDSHSSFIPLNKPPLKPSYQIQLEIYYDNGAPNKTVLVNVYNEHNPKPFLGGFRHTVSGLMYHHASIQTDPIEPKQVSNVPRFHRETQTKKFKSMGQQTLREQGTQMEKPGLLLDNSEDRIIVASDNYFDSTMLEELRHEMAVKIQRNVRMWIAKARVNRIRDEKYQKLDEKEQQKRRAHEMEMERKQKEIKRRMHPRKKDDFSVMYDELEAWRLKETATINETTQSGSIERRQALKELLRKETKLLQTIDRLKIVANQQNISEKIQFDLEKMAKPKKVEYVNTTKVNYNRARDYKEGAAPNNEKDETNVQHAHVETPFTVRARELRDLYYGLNTEMLSVDERLDVLLHVKWTVKEFQDDTITKDIVDLIDREADLLNRGRKDNSLVGLRKRISNLFLQFIQTPKYNPEAIILINRKKSKMKNIIESGKDNTDTDNLKEEYVIEPTRNESFNIESDNTQLVDEEPNASLLE